MGSRGQSAISLASIAAENGTNLVTTSYTYNKRRLPVSERMQWGSVDWSIGYAYNANGHLSSQTSPDGLGVAYAPNALGQPTQAGSYATGVQYYPNGALKQFSYGNGIVHTMTQNARQLPIRSTDCTLAGACAAANRRLDLGYGFDAHGNVSAITDYTTGARQTRAMTYDTLDRLTQTTSAMFGTASYGYNVLDNLTTLNVSGGSKARNHAYVYDAKNQLVNVTTGVGGPTVVGLGYDVQGNVNNKSGTTYTFDYGNRLRSVGGASPASSYVYDGHGRRVRDLTTGSKYSLYSQSGQLVWTSDYRTGKNTAYIYLGGSLVAFRERTGASPNYVYTNLYQHTDALGTPIAVTDASKAVIETFEYEPFGQLVNSTLKDGPGYTGHVQDAATGLTYMQQRYYDPTIGRFLSVDPVTANSGTGGNFNRYWYANNNPYKFVDPDGRFICNRSRAGIAGCQDDLMGPQRRMPSGGCQRANACQKQGSEYIFR
jgi:RHS repeat-associated protein